MKLSALIDSLKPDSFHPRSDPEIKGLAYDSRQVKPGYVFFALKGQRQDGMFFVQDAIERGAEVIISEQSCKISGTPGLIGKGQVIMLPVGDARQAMAEAARVFYQNPSARLKMIGLTGTNGKTTAAFLIKNILDAAGLEAGLIGTVIYKIGTRIIPATRTTPEVIDLQQMLDQMVTAGCRSAVMEVSSHALSQKRTWGIDFDAAVFTNLTHDHLDYHKTMEKYFQAKSLLFKQLNRGQKKAVALINIDDPHGEALLKMPELKTTVFTYGLNEKADVRALNVQLASKGSVFDVVSPWGKVKISLRLPGRYNVSNALAAFSVCAALGGDPVMIARVLPQIIFIPGRLEEIETGRGFQVFVDYAHTEDALRNVLTTLREISKGRIITVFGCGGNRDAKKRPWMGSVAEQMADYVIITSDNPRREDPNVIISQILAGCKTRDKVEVVPDRYEAIAHALSLAHAGDVVLVAGKGHENYQEFANTIIPFDDRQVVRECLGLRNGKI
jgi:UDP-N-acetylmuramoyl-L-alanyl-D-glutamate--2,6-diaminopimelate ligase